MAARKQCQRPRRILLVRLFSFVGNAPDLVNVKLACKNFPAEHSIWRDIAIRKIRTNDPRQTERFTGTISSAGWGKLGAKEGRPKCAFLVGNRPPTQPPLWKILGTWTHSSVVEDDHRSDRTRRAIIDDAALVLSSVV
jgi:hypothetical protein